MKNGPKKRLYGALTLVVLLGAAGGAIGFDNIVFWAWASEAQEIGQVAYRSAISDKQDLLIRVEQQLRECEARLVDCSYTRGQINRLIGEIEDLQRKRAKYAK